MAVDLQQRRPNMYSGGIIPAMKLKMAAYVERQPPCPRATTILAGFQAAEVGVSFNVSG